jgi:hypothetical protein
VCGEEAGARQQSAILILGPSCTCVITSKMVEYLSCFNPVFQLGNDLDISLKVDHGLASYLARGN